MTKKVPKIEKKFTALLNWNREYNAGNETDRLLWEYTRPCRHRCLYTSSCCEPFSCTELQDSKHATK